MDENRLRCNNSWDGLQVQQQQNILLKKVLMTPGEKILTWFLFHISLILIWYGGLNPASTLFYYRYTNISFNVMQNINI
jgi:hypothetical protein